MKRSLFAAVAAMMLATPHAISSPGEVTAVSILPAAGRAQVVIDVRGSVSVQDFTLNSPARLVVDITGATLAGRTVRYDGVNRGGILNVRYSQFRSDVVRVVIELESLRDYQLESADGAIRVSFGTDRTFSAWSTLAQAALAAAEAVESVGSPYATPPTRTQASLVQQASQQPTITVTYDSAAIADVMAGLAAFSGSSIVLGKNVTGYVTAEIRNQPWDVAFKAILESHGLAAVQDPSGIIRVDSRDELAKRDSVEVLRTQIIRMNYARAATLIPSVNNVLTGRGKVVADTGTNSLVITDVESKLQEHVEFVSQLDIRTPQVAIQAKLIFVDRTDVEALGVRYDLGQDHAQTGAFGAFNRLLDRRSGDPASGPGPNDYGVRLGGSALAAMGNAEAALPARAVHLLFSTVMGNFQLTTFLEALQQVEMADIQAEPLISTADNREAYILVGERTPVRVIDATGAAGAVAQVEMVETGIKLLVRPSVTANRQIFMTVKAENSSIRAAPADLGFTFQTQEAQTEMLVNDGETAVIGGLTVTEVTGQRTGIPVLMNIPFIGKLFGVSERREQRRDLLILVTPHIVDDPEAPRIGRAGS